MAVRKSAFRLQQPFHALAEIAATAIAQLDAASWAPVDAPEWVWRGKRAIFKHYVHFDGRVAAAVRISRPFDVDNCSHRASPSL